MLTDDHLELLELLKNSNKTLAILGLFSKQDGDVRYVFNNNNSKDDEKNGKISVVELFEKLKPELRSSSDSTLTIGDDIFNQYELKTPLDAGDSSGYSQQILFDSPLLDGTKYFGGTEAETIQKTGKEIVKQLLESLDKVAYYSDSRFTKSLLKIAKNYLITEANKNLKNKIAIDAQWFDTFISDPLLCSKIVQYLTAYEQDESAIETAFKLHLNSVKNDSGKTMFTSEQVDKLMEALAKCKKIMLLRATEDPTWSDMAKSKDFNWLKDYPSDPEYGLSHQLPGDGAKDKSFFAYYANFIKASDQVHRLIRTQAIHSSVFCWLAGKYKHWDCSANSTRAAEKMFEIGVEDQGEQRIRAGSVKERLENYELIKATTINPELAEQVGGNQNYQTFAEIAQDNIYKVLVPIRSVTSKSLQDRARNMFKLLKQMAGGKAGEILLENDKFNQAFVKYYRIILNAEKASLNEIEVKLKTLAKTDQELKEFEFNINEFIDKIINKAKEETGIQDARAAVRKAFVSTYAEASKTRFATIYLENQALIKEEEFIAEKIYDLKNGMITTAKDKEAGLPMLVITPTSPLDKDQLGKGKEEKGKKAIAKEAVKALGKNSPSTITAPSPTAMENIPNNTSGSINDSGGQSIGTWKKDDNQIKLTPSSPEKGAELRDNPVIIHEGAELLVVNTATLPEVAQFSTKEDIEKQQNTIETVANKYNLLSEAIDSVLNKYREEDNTLLNRGFRSMLLCEYIQAAPKGTTQLGREDLSNILGLMVDIVEHLGEIKNGDVDTKILNTVLSENPELLNLLKKINLSQYYPVEDKNGISAALQYQFHLSEKLNNVKSYIQELGEIRNLFEILKDTDLKIVVINSKLQDYIDNIGAADSVFFNADSPSIVYLTAQSGADTNSLNSTAQTIVDLIKDPSGAPKLQMPIFITSQDNLSPEAVPLPLVCPKNVKLPRLLPKGIQPSKDELDINVANWQEPQNLFLLLGAAVMLPSSSTVMGSVESVVMKVNKNMEDQYGFKTLKEEAVVDLLRKIWLSTNGKVRLIDTLIFTKWLNLAILALRKDASLKIKIDFGNILEKEISDLATIGDYAFSRFEQLRSIPVKVKNKTQLVPPSGMSSSGINMNETYGTQIKGEQYTFDVKWNMELSKLL